MVLEDIVLVWALMKTYARSSNDIQLFIANISFIAKPVRFSRSDYKTRNLDKTTYVTASNGRYFQQTRSTETSHNFTS
jgi:hypothetical protein